MLFLVFTKRSIKGYKGFTPFHNIYDSVMEGILQSGYNCLESSNTSGQSLVYTYFLHTVIHHDV